MKKVLALAMLILFIFTGNVYGDGNLEDGLSTVLLGDQETGNILYEYNIDAPVEIASITKLMTYLVTMDEVTKGTVSLDDTVTVGRNPTLVGGSSFKLKEGEQLSLRLLLDTILIPSANDSSVAIAEHISGTEKEFVKLMNAKAKEIGLENTLYLNSSGMPEKEGQNTMTARDIFNLSRYVIEKYPEILNVTKLTSIEVVDRNFKKNSTNLLLKSMENIDGLKTGYTDKAGYCLVATLEIPQSIDNDQPYRLIGITMGAKSEDDRVNKTASLLNYGIENYNKKLAVTNSKSIENIQVGNAKIIDLEIFPKDTVYALVKKGDEVRQEIVLNDEIKAPLKKGDRVGKVMIYNGDHLEKEVDLIIDRDVYKANVFVRIYRYILNLFGK